jgi:hypothetical protein
LLRRRRRQARAIGSSALFRRKAPGKVLDEVCAAIPGDAVAGNARHQRAPVFSAIRWMPLLAPFLSLWNIPWSCLS